MSRPEPIVAPLPGGGSAREDRADAEALLARAFRDNPLTQAVVGEGPERRLRANRRGMHALLEAARAGALIRVARCRGQGTAGLLIAVAPGDFPLPRPGTRAQLGCLIGQGWRVMNRWGRVYRALEAIHPLEPHWYLALLGVEPARQREGLGSALLADFLRHVDAQSQPSYLETDRPENVAFYRRAGFEVADERRLMGVPVWCLWRPRRVDTPPRSPILSE